MATPKIVKFNVGESKFEVSKSLLDRYPTCMLSGISSDRWKQEGASEDDAIFIERNGDRFQYVLDYMRDSKVELPLSVPRGQFVADLEYFALDYDDASITLSVANPNDLFHSLAKYRDYFIRKNEEINKKLKGVAAEKLACELAKEYFSQLIHPKPVEVSTSGYRPHPSQNTQPSANYFDSTNIKVTVPNGLPHLKREDIH